MSDVNLKYLAVPCVDFKMRMSSVELHLRAPAWGFREPGEWGPKQPGSREQVVKKTREQGAEKLIWGAGSRGKSLWSRGKSVGSRQQMKLIREQLKNS